MRKAIRSMFGLAQSQERGCEYSADRQRGWQSADWLAFQALRLLVVLHNRTSLVEMWLARRRGSRLGTINLTEEQRQDGWRLGWDKAGYCYAYNEEREEAPVEPPPPSTGD